MEAGTDRDKPAWTRSSNNSSALACSAARCWRAFHHTGAATISDKAADARTQRDSLGLLCFRRTAGTGDFSSEVRNPAKAF